MTMEDRPPSGGRLMAIWRGRRLEHLTAAILGAVAVGWCAMRFIGLEKVPPGAGTDEMLAGLHVECLAQTGASADGVRWPLFAEGLGGGLYTPTYLYTLFVWTRVFGISVASLRALSAVFSVVAIVGLGLLARRVAGHRAALLAVVAASLSPWSFQVARLAVDAPMAPALVVWGVYFFMRSPRVPSALAGGTLLALGAYTYPPVRVMVPLLTILLLVIERPRLSARRLTAFLGAMAVVAAPLVVRVLDGRLMGRAKDLSIFTDAYVHDHSGPFLKPVFFVKQALENLFEHLRPSYLFFSGDPNIRHSTQVMGQLGWLDILALVCFGVTIGVAVFRTFASRASVDQSPSRCWLVAGCAIFAGGFATIPAALCWEGLPHAFRSMAAWPAVALFTGAALSGVWSRWPLVRVVAAALVLAQTAHFVPYYFSVYPKKSHQDWAGHLREAAESRDPARFAEVVRPVEELGFRYLLVRYFGDTCASSREHAQRIARGGL
jgi:4-amino-4-deoxy-L-arabinose transferase-like glycosyltransferase